MCFYGKVDECGYWVCGNIWMIIWKFGNFIICINKLEFLVCNLLFVECERYVGFIDNCFLFWYKVIIDLFNVWIIVWMMCYDLFYRFIWWSIGVDEFKEMRLFLCYF